MNPSDIIAEATKSVTGIGALITAGAGFLLMIRSARQKGRADSEAGNVTGKANYVGPPSDADEIALEVQALREKSVKDARQLFELRRRLAEQGLDA